ncbi:raffinose/stachyose/melibiose transport system substrate-binding protein [Ruminiclostridium sufflavum DSM 19573]|uniref:Raffinose/stachyose/melibiose transport system substrate-binding protein n=1 Tax=Ruminiclostridium sufflavum DSM 19573 TaxID=1121337 RepID=A0A318XLP0_9FIRM|nr:extracellular solute-binding protein [Ruminiclostridium sufflavum]PYG88247.1 raffinose/stachyose/melibiose transport system substrate-binding protein [Ruminiclostridium sufflavum DSM 19573]
MKKYLKAGLSGLLAVAMTAALVGCGGGSASEDTSASADSKVQKEPITLKFPTYLCGTNVGAAPFKVILENFNKQYGDEITVKVEEIPSDDAYKDKIKVLMSSGDLPDVINGKQGLFDLAVKGGFALDFTPYMDADPEWKASVTEAALKANSRDGKMYSVTETADVVGYFYNKEMFQKAGITPAKTWDEWFSNCDKLKAAGFTPLALMTGENSWTTNLILASLIGTNGEAGNTFMNTLHPKNYNTPEVIDSLTKMQKMLQDYTTSDAVGAKYNDAANNFLSEKAAIIANGSWMIGDFSNTEKAAAGFDKKVGCAAYPESGIVTAYREGWMVTSDDDAHKEAAVKFVKALTEDAAQLQNLELSSVIPLSPTVNISDEFKEKNPILAELINANSSIKYRYLEMDNIDYANVTDAFANLYPALAMNKMTAEQVVQQLNETAAKNTD